MTSSPPSTDRRLTVFLVVLFCTALAAHFHFATLNWRYRFMLGHEFRQTQTALIAHYIDREDNFSIDYSVPLLGKPWVLPLEFPLYEWGVVALGRATGWPLHQAARTLSLASFYLTLPALFLLLGQLGLPRPHRLFVLACVLACPVYLFYSRAVLIDPTALLFSVWFLAAFARMLAAAGDRAPSGRTTGSAAPWGWLVAVVLCGTAAGLIKSLVWFVWVLPAAAYGAWRLWQAWRGGGWRPALRVCAWGVGSVLLPFAATFWWAGYTDAIKAAHPSAYIFTSANLGIGNYGTLSLSARVSSDTWRNLLLCWQQSLLPPWLFALFVLPGLAFLRGWRRRIAGATALFLAAQLSIPLAYAYQDYYFYAANAFAVAAVAFVFLGLLERLPRGVATTLLLVPLIAFFATYRASYFPWAQVRSHGGSGLTEALKAYTPPDSVLVVAGADWSAIIPYYAERKALMIRRGLENDPAYLDRAFADLAGEEIGAFVLCPEAQGRSDLVERVARAFDTATTPTFTHPDGEVYLNTQYRDTLLRGLRHTFFDRVTTTAPLPPEDPVAGDDTVSPALARTIFRVVSPAPARARATFGFGCVDAYGVLSVNAHPDSDLWIPPPAGATSLAVEFGIQASAYSGDHDPTNGVEFIIEAERPDGSLRLLFRRVLEPASVAADRGVQTLRFDCRFAPDETVVFRTRPNGSAAFDWAFWRRIEIK